MCKLLAIVALLLSLPALADPKAGEKKAQLCLLCHKTGNNMAYLPTLEGQTREYLTAQMRAFKERRRSDSAMQTNVSGLSDRDMRDIAEYFAAQKPVKPVFSPDPDKIARGKSAAGTMGCAQCHGPAYQGAKEVPRLAGMEPRYLASRLASFAAGARSHHPTVPGLQQLSAANQEELAQFFASLD